MHKDTSLKATEKKIMLVITTFIFFSIYTLASVSNTIAVSNRLKSALNEYFKCEALGHVPGKCSRKHFEKFMTPYVSAISYLVLGFIPLSILNFLFKWKSLRSLTTKCITNKGK